MTLEAGDSEPILVREPGPYQVYIWSIGNRRELVLPFLRQWIGGIETLAAVRYKVERDIKLVRPTLYGLSKESAEAVAARLNSWGAAAAVYHDQDENRPQFDHNRYGLNLLEVGTNRDAVNTAVQKILGIDRFNATILMDSAPKRILENVSIDVAIAGHEQLQGAGAICEISVPEPVWLDTSTAHIPRNPGPYLVTIQHIGPQTILVDKTVADFLPHLSQSERQELLSTLPTVLVQNVSMETAELVKLKLEHFAATVIIQETTKREELGQLIHAQNPDFGFGNYRIIIDGYEPHKKISVIQQIRRLIPGIHLTEIMSLLNNMPASLIENVDEKSAAAIQKRLGAAGGLVTLAKD
ncbi:MAG: ribosomal protein L7/L12 [Candidatus Promineifilaceae bacterium]|nr:ribosomal protein L7/L12 [Candidatus Promineifilaceae bacterium]